MSCRYSKVHDAMIPDNTLFPTLEQLAARRNPLSPAMERKKQAEFKKYHVEHKPDEVYALAYGPVERPIYFYCGITNDLERRELNHKYGMLDPVNLKRAYIFAREVMELGHTIRFVHLGPANDISEAMWLDALLADGHPMQNEGSCVDNKRKKTPLEIAKAMKPKTTAKFKQVMQQPTKLKLVLNKPD